VMLASSSSTASMWSGSMCSRTSIQHTRSADVATPYYGKAGS
jgi:hypothetical protein